MQCAKSLRNYHNLCLIKKIELVIAVIIFDFDIPPCYLHRICCAMMKYFIKQTDQEKKKGQAPKVTPLTQNPRKKIAPNDFQSAWSIIMHPLCIGGL